MGLRAILLGFASAAFICGYTYFNHEVLRQTMLIGNHMPISVFGGLVIFLLALNPLLRYLSRRWAFSGRELAVVLALTLAACTVPSAGLLRSFTT